MVVSSFDEINQELQELAQEAIDAMVEAQYDAMLEEMYGSDPRWHGPDRDDDGLWYWENEWES
jgi:hypothetical protein